MISEFLSAICKKSYSSNDLKRHSAYDVLMREGECILCYIQDM